MIRFRQHANIHFDALQTKRIYDNFIGNFRVKRDSSANSVRLLYRITIIMYIHP